MTRKKASDAARSWVSKQADECAEAYIYREKSGSYFPALTLDWSDEDFTLHSVVCRLHPYGQVID